MKIGRVDLLATAKATIKDFMADDLQGLAAEVTYHLLFSLVPLLIFLTALSGFAGRWVGTGDVVERITGWLRRDANLPQATIDIVLQPIEQVLREQASGLLSFGAVFALWSGKNAIAALIKALNVAYDVTETRPWWKKTAIAIGLTVALGLAVVGSSLFFLSGSVIGGRIADWFGLSAAWTTVWAWLRWPLIVLLLAVALAVFYWAGPNVDARLRWLTPGALLTVLLWAAATFGLNLYFHYFAGYVSAYGVLGGLLGFVFWLYVMSLILLLGGELNSVLAGRHDPVARARIADPARRMSDAGAKRRQAAGSQGVEEPASDRPEVPPAPLPPMVEFPALARALPSAERQARAALAAEGRAGHTRRSRSAIKALALSLAAVLSAVAVGLGRR